MGVSHPQCHNDSIPFFSSCKQILSHTLFCQFSQVKSGKIKECQIRPQIEISLEQIFEICGLQFLTTNCAFIWYTCGCLSISTTEGAAVALWQNNSIISINVPILQLAQRWLKALRQRVSNNYLDWAKYQNRHSSKSSFAKILP